MKTKKGAAVGTAAPGKPFRCVDPAPLVGAVK